LRFGVGAASNGVMEMKRRSSCRWVLEKCSRKVCSIWDDSVGRLGFEKGIGAGVRSWDGIDVFFLLRHVELEKG
jgi:hypothetical protein